MSEKPTPKLIAPAEQRTTAQRLGAYHRELMDEGIPGQLADVLVADAARVIIRIPGAQLRVKPE